MFCLLKHQCECDVDGDTITAKQTFEPTVKSRCESMERLFTLFRLVTEKGLNLNYQSAADLCI